MSKPVVGLIKAKKNKSGELEYRIFNRGQKKYITIPMNKVEMEKFLQNQGVDSRTIRKSIFCASTNGTSAFFGSPEDLDREEW